ncbi:signal peptidase II [Acidihalobacter ferrooxydans]|uniref:Lipoprotein signal peptidase n=1 Tax=Acidihalobacter ferrooxydans TaxID=1765967 RepID=A0A1P8UKR9_9GAMM|nr:signal peptidase II [Acidihalobacter ferrooxydans]APZ44438.1 signal peptidase II [Acidihalobacter ferrooxydans]
MLRWLWLSVAVIVLDQSAKWAALRFLPYAIPQPVFPGFNLTLVFNTGAAFSFLNQAGGCQRWLFVGLALAVSGILIGWLMRLQAHERWTAAALALILGGALSNALDRILRGHVIDFIQIYYRQWAWPTFNLADSAITLGAAILIFRTLIASPQDARKKTKK